ncbi:hypothetical protein FNW02_10015 [Komarekiella sp. 'clone 1']|uniref:Uncharacterized protein n=1 Tax=Komarekiella delphini-convector SJRDD-AB1 TaxID=2593771 RepID=A0AA40SVQ4_9NOST|nr:hypothetical protein [Komarekiella delphini-convector SJRDD-AB1]
MTLGTFRSPLTPLKKGGTGIKVPLFKGDLEGSRTFDTDKRTFQTSSEAVVGTSTIALVSDSYCSVYTLKKCDI